jgi:hypothetical protein
MPDRPEPGPSDPPEEDGDQPPERGVAGHFGDDEQSDEGGDSDTGHGG